MDDAETHTIASRRSQEQRAGQPIITPSGEVSGVVGNNIPITQALEEAIGTSLPLSWPACPSDLDNSKLLSRQEQCFGIKL